MTDTTPPALPLPDVPLPASPLIDAIRGVVGERGLLTDPADTAPYCEDWRRLYRGRTPAVVRPATHAGGRRRGAAVRRGRGRRSCRRAAIPRMVGGATPARTAAQIVLSLSRMNRVRDIDPVDMTMDHRGRRHAEGGAGRGGRGRAACCRCRSASEGSAQIGGVLATNAGGNNTVRYGNARDLVLGLEVVLADGQVWNGLRRLRKDNTGYCLRQLFVGSEGTLGIITAAVLKLCPRPRETAVALCAVPSPEAALDLFTRFQPHDPAAIQAFEYMSGAGDGSRAAAHPRRARCRSRSRRRITCWSSWRRRARTPVCAARSRQVLARRWRRASCRRGDRRKRRAARGDLAAARGALGGAEARRRLGQERRLGAGLESARS